MTRARYLLAPLVEPAAELTPEEVRRYARHLLVPDVGVARAAAAEERAGAGRRRWGPGLARRCSTWPRPGSAPSASSTPDVVEESNLQRQVVHGAADVGRLKVESARDRVGRGQPARAGADAPGAAGLRERAGRAVAATTWWSTAPTTSRPATWSTTPARCSASPACGARSTGSTGRPASGSPGTGPCYRCVFPEPPPPGLVPSCAEGGVLGRALRGDRLDPGHRGGQAGDRDRRRRWSAAWWCTTRCARPGARCAVRADPSLCRSACGVSDRHRADRLRRLLRTAHGRNRISPASSGAAARTQRRLVTARELSGLLADAGGRAGRLRPGRRPRARRARDRVHPGRRAVPRAAFHNGDAWQQLPFDKRVILHCRSGVRSAECLTLLRAAGHPDAARTSTAGCWPGCRTSTRACRPTDGAGRCR